MIYSGTLSQKQHNYPSSQSQHLLCLNPLTGFIVWVYSQSFEVVDVYWKINSKLLRENNVSCFLLNDNYKFIDLIFMKPFDLNIVLQFSVSQKTSMLKP